MIPSVDFNQSECNFASAVKASVDDVGIVVLDNAIDPSLASMVHLAVRDWGQQYRASSSNIWYQQGSKLQKTMHPANSPFLRCEVKRNNPASISPSKKIEEIDQVISDVYGAMDECVSRVFDALILSSDILLEYACSSLSLLSYERPESADSDWGDLQGHVDGHNLVTCHAMATDSFYWADLKNGKKQISLNPDQLMLSFGSLAKDHGLTPVRHGITIPSKVKYREAIVGFYQ